ncbi:mitochondrial import receptor subunit TOM20 homolog [Amphibalanus amphitrite]|uniref:mitochondrial import receptor subunit TOM20 homolog n=1 Tax=Amphibalanus amphitrite TaxID=1232801 RepID=UPI001C9292A9|nr:mitochondrial import receptor subunit TOM20 homolog [Amphibalanus amphitrite]XP_043219895.1 mitochondrial import receptor subunit TOM20 homolog [Amphibalanus amphitrite]
MTMLSRTTVGIAAVCGTLFMGYCIYFDKKRRSAPDFKKKLREKRRKQGARAAAGGSALPDLRSQEEVQTFFLQEVQLGEELLAQGNMEDGVEHLCNAVAVCHQPQQLLQVLQQTVPPQVFQLLLQRLPLAGQRLAASAAAKESASITEDDVE